MFIQGSVLEELQNRIRNLEEEKDRTQKECSILRQKVEELKGKVSPEIDTVSCTIFLCYCLSAIPFGWLYIKTFWLKSFVYYRQERGIHFMTTSILLFQNNSSLQLYGPHNFGYDLPWFIMSSWTMIKLWSK